MLAVRPLIHYISSVNDAVPTSVPVTAPHPCLRCGACCAIFRVTFAASELLPESLDVPAELTIPGNPGDAVMRGTERDFRIRCVALTGRVGKNASCSIYERRPSPCRKFEASYAYGVQEIRCDEARAGHGLPPLTLRDFDGVRNFKRS